MKIIISDMKNTLDGINGKLNIPEELFFQVKQTGFISDRFSTCADRRDNEKLSVLQQAL